MTKEYDLEDTLSFPKPLFEKILDGYHIILAPRNPNWIILNENEYQMFHWLHGGASIRSTLENYYKENCQNEEICLNIMTKLLEQINDVCFFDTADIKEEEPIETITKKVHIGATNGCNMHCPHCYMAAGTEPLKTINLQKTIQLISELHEIYGELEIVVSGGEPLTYKNIKKLLLGIRGNKITLFTNGTLISGDNIDVICECCNEIQISFEAVSKNLYSKIRGDGNYEKVLHALELLKNRGKRIVLAITILPSTLNDIRDNLINFINKFNYKNIEVRISDEIELSGNALSMNMSGFNKKESKELVIYLVRELHRLGCAVQVSNNRNIRFTNCGIGTNIIINYDGKIYPCHKLSSYSFDIETSTKIIINNFNKLNIETSNNGIPKCLTCELEYICSGGCRIDNLKKTGSMIKPICDEDYKIEQYRRLLNDYRMYHERV